MVVKAGYGTACEAMAAGTPMIYPPRTGFAEHRALDRALRAWGGGVPASARAFEELRLERLLDQRLRAEARPGPVPRRRRLARGRAPGVDLRGDVEAVRRSSAVERRPALGSPPPNLRRELHENRHPSRRRARDAWTCSGRRRLRPSGSTPPTTPRPPPRWPGPTRSSARSPPSCSPGPIACAGSRRSRPAWSTTSSPSWWRTRAS